MTDNIKHYAYIFWVIQNFLNICQLFQYFDIFSGCSTFRCVVAQKRKNGLSQLTSSFRGTGSMFGINSSIIIALYLLLIFYIVPDDEFTKRKHVSYAWDKEYKFCFAWWLNLLSSVDIFLKGSNLKNTYWKGRTKEVIKTTPYYQSDKTTHS